MAMHDYAHEALDLAMVARRAVNAGDPSVLVPHLGRAEESVLRAAGVRADERELRTGVSARAVEEETQALLVTVLRADPLAWFPACSSCGGSMQHRTRQSAACGRCVGVGFVPGVVDVNHSPQGAAKSAFQAAVMKRAGAGAGWPDLDVRLVTPSGPHALLFELKVGRGRESREQRDRQARMVSAGFDCRVARGLGEVLLAVVRLLIGENSAEVPF